MIGKLFVYTDPPLPEVGMVVLDNVEVNNPEEFFQKGLEVHPDVFAVNAYVGGSVMNGTPYAWEKDMQGRWWQNVMSENKTRWFPNQDKP